MIGPEDRYGWLQEQLTNIIDTLVNDNQVVGQWCHELACIVVEVPAETVFGDTELPAGVDHDRWVSEDDPRYDRYWQVYSAELVRALTQVALKNMPHYRKYTPEELD
jgi:hypothetical protein